MAHIVKFLKITIKSCEERHGGIRSFHPVAARSTASGISAAQRNEQPMSASTTAVRSRWLGWPQRWAILATACLMASGTATIVARAGAADASVAPVVTRAAIDPSLTTGRGANVPFVEEEAENAVTNGTIIGPSTQPYT